MIKEITIAEKPQGTGWNKALTYDVVSHIDTTYCVTKKLLCKVHLFENNIQKTIKIFDSSNSINEFKNDKFLEQWFIDLQNHRLQHNILILEEMIVEIDENDQDFLTWKGKFGAFSFNGDALDVSSFFKPV
jgi:hypothetical protein